MINISDETAIATKIRLARLMPSVVVRRLPARFAFSEDAEPVNWAAGDLAVIRGEDGRSVVRPAADDAPADNTLDAFEIRFSTPSDNSGFIGYLASRLKEMTGAGSVVLCGAEQGRIFDYYLVPTPVAALAGRYLDHLTRATPVSEFGFDDRVFEVSGTTQNSEITPDTRFIFRMSGETLVGEYCGGTIVAGHILGRSEQPNRYRFGYTQLNALGGIATGTSSLSVDRTGDGRFHMIEEYVRSDGGTGENRFVEVG